MMKPAGHHSHAGACFLHIFQELVICNLSEFHLQDVMRDLLSEFYEDALGSLENQIQKAKQPRITHEAPDYPKEPASKRMQLTCTSSGWTRQHHSSCSLLDTSIEFGKKTVV